ncbi:putative protein with domain of unknown function (DUF4598) [Lyophyllum shimeji]|uniref:Uncharacterized protein n=1 Tax=Lyophyllum shimeji TaxID=47721 RepID=A0A9P3UUE9_LYOSH|nr:putative protein with domain of unknown function (DUF4598) [Lyophyllum shimeji]
MNDDRGGHVRLDVEDEDERLRRIQTTLEKLNASSSSSTSESTSSRFLNKELSLSKPCHVPPPSELLSRVTAFLPALQASNALLEQRAQQDPKSVDIEHIDEGMGQYIEMNLGLGVFESRPPGFPEDATTSSGSPSASSSSASSSSASDTDASYDSDSESDAEIITSFTPIRPIKPLPRRSWGNRRPQIVVLPESQGEGSDHGMAEGRGLLAACAIHPSPNPFAAILPVVAVPNATTRVTTCLHPVLRRRQWTCSPTPTCTSRSGCGCASSGCGESCVGVIGKCKAEVIAARGVR